MNKIILLLGLLLLLPIVLAGNENGKITAGKDLLITDVDITVDGRTSRNLEYNDDITKIAKPGSKIKIKIEVTNNHTDLSMTEIDMIVTIDELDLEKVINEFDLSKSADKTITVEFTLPSDTEEQDYEIFIEAGGELNNSIHRVEYILDLEVEEPDVEIISTSTKTELQNISDTLKNIDQEIGSYFQPYATCVSERDSLKEQLKTKDTTIASLQGFSDRFTTCNNEKTECVRIREQKDIANRTCYSQIKNVYIPEIEKSKNWGFLGFFGALILAYGFWQYKEKWGKPKAEHEETKSDVS